MTGFIQISICSKWVSRESVSVQINPTKTCTDERQTCRNKQCYSCPRIQIERSIFLSACQSAGLTTGQVAYVSGVNNVLWFSMLNPFGILMTHNGLDSIRAVAKQRCGTEICACSEHIAKGTVMCCFFMDLT